MNDQQINNIISIIDNMVDPADQTKALKDLYGGVSLNSEIKNYLADINNKLDLIVHQLCSRAVGDPRIQKAYAENTLSESGKHFVEDFMKWQEKKEKEREANKKTF